MLAFLLSCGDDEAAGDVAQAHLLAAQVERCGEHRFIGDGGAALHLRGQEMSLRDISARLVIAAGKKKGQHPSPATVMRMLREHDEKTAAAALVPAGA